MAQHNKLGRRGENLARQFLEQKGYEILETNWRYQRAEVDIIARQEEWLVFVEVKTRTSEIYGRPETFFTPAKGQLMAQAAFAYIEETNHSGEVRFDVISILIPPNGPSEITHFEDAFFPGL